MPVQYIATIGATRNLDKEEVTRDDGVFAAPGTNQIRIYIGDNVDRSRRNEIREGLRWLFRGLVERDIFTSFAGAVVYSACPLNDLSIAARKTSSQLTDVTADDIGIAIGSFLMDNSKGHGPIETSFKRLREVFIDDPVQ